MAIEKMAKGESLGIPGVIVPGDGKKLRASLLKENEHLSWAPKDADAHHLIPSEVIQRPGIREMLERIGFDANRASNGILLPKGEGILGATSLSVHNGGHPGYREAVSDYLQSIASASVANGDKWAIAKIREAQLLMRQKLRQGVPLDLAGDDGGVLVGRQWRDIFNTLIP